MGIFVVSLKRAESSTWTETWSYSDRWAQRCSLTFWYNVESFFFLQQSLLLIFSNNFQRQRSKRVLVQCEATTNNAEDQFRITHMVEASIMNDLHEVLLVSLCFPVAYLRFCFFKCCDMWRWSMLCTLCVCPCEDKPRYVFLISFIIRQIEKPAACFIMSDSAQAYSDVKLGLLFNSSLHTFCL